ncbi:transmembrane sensor [Novosphingobium fluoreni]|uniref:Transmembrane sensor n=1 Tax=Novosphingobium fluoreni TaxID=1391222 RepID=A0A7W6C414_9SPHN|nr:FecR domain-containing protein [Novosphingobium fluoreni]MBB3941750.1 transmembrane sensor [Novosphingobium fluoreni]
MTRQTRTRRQALRDEAAGWFALMRGPDAELSRPAFETWLAADPLHRDAFNRIGETFSLGKGLKLLPDAKSGAFSGVTVASAPRSLTTVVRRAAIAMVLVIGIVSATTLLLHNLGAFVSAPPAQQRVLATARGEVRDFALADGSRLTLDTDSDVSVSFSAARRDLALTRGRARFAVAHEARPFVVAAAGNLVIARGTVFDITLGAHRTAVVDLIEGAVDVRSSVAPQARRPGEASATRQSAATRLTAGHSLALGTAQVRPSPRLPASRDWPDGLRDFRAVRLGDLVGEANRYAGKPIVLASPDLAGLQVSGTFGIRDTERLAGNLAELLGLAVRHNGEALVLVRR